MLAVANRTLVATPFGGSKVVNAQSISRMKQGSRVVNEELRKMRNAELLSHSVESHAGFERLGMENILSFFKTGKALTAVNNPESHREVVVTSGLRPVGVMMGLRALTRQD